MNERVKAAQQIVSTVDDAIQRHLLDLNPPALLLTF
jgi:hypothetical protein